MVSFIAFPLVSQSGIQVPEGVFPYTFMMVGEVIMGLILGFVVLLLFIGIQFAGQLAGLQMGFGIVNVIDPQSSEQVSIIGQFLNILAILLVLTLNGHHLILQGLVHSFEVVPLGGIEFKEVVMQKLVVLSNEVFIIAIKISIPVLLSLFLISVAMGILARTVPQMNVFIVGFPVQLAVGLSVLVASLPLFYIILNKALKVLERNYYSFFDFFS